jgi:uncharacterized protein (TIGR03086 family)
MTSTENPSTLDPRAVFGRAFATAGEVLGGLRPEDMGRPTPCTEYDVRTLAGHLLAVAQRVRNVGRGESPFSVPEVVEGVADDGWVEAWDETGEAVTEAWADDATLERMIELPWATMPGSATLIMWSNELSVHTWDLATATGQSPDWDEAVLEAAFAAMQVGLPAESRMESFEAARQNMPEGMEGFTPPFAAAVDVPDGAPLIDRLVAWNGRDPR